MKLNRYQAPAGAFLAIILLLCLSSLLVWPLLSAQAGPPLPSRQTPTPTSPPASDSKGDGDKPVGAHIELRVQSAPAELWTVVQWQDSAGGWHDVEGWLGTLDARGKKVWWVAAKDFDTGPFRWRIHQGQGGEPLFTSESFYLPHAAGETVWVEASLEP